MTRTGETIDLGFRLAVPPAVVLACALGAGVLLLHGC
jgi:hypothetical protein